MDEAAWTRQWDLFFEALERPPAERESFVASAAAGDEALKHAVLELLASHESAAEVLDRPALLTIGTEDAEPSEDPLIGAWLGPYHLQEVIGAGGMGVVYAAEQVRPVRRRVACKVTRLGLQSREVTARFELEREALARMSHSGIARVFDAGTTADGRLYFVMELIDGEPITEFCDQRRLSVRDRLELFTAVCEAVQHAHGKGIIHRDLKPSNVLVTLEGERAVPKIIDFGVAKALDTTLTPDPLVTTLGAVIGTPMYMSPEQVTSDRADIDTGSDIYALSVILYELLSGAVPFDADLIRKLGIAEFERVVRTRPPDSPTARFAREDEATRATRAANRRTTQAELSRLLRGDLDAIVLKGLAKDRTERYATALELGTDVHRYLAGRAVLARAPTRRYRVGKFVRRHRAGVAFAALAVVIVIGAAITVAVEDVRLNRALRQAALERDRNARVAGFLTELFSVADPNVSNGENVTVRSVLDRGAAEIESSLTEDPGTRAAVLDSMAEAYRALGLYDRSAALITQSRAARERLRADRAGLAGTLHIQGKLEQDRGDLDAAERDLRNALLLLESERSRGPLTADVMGDLAVLLRDRGAYAEATGWAVRTVELRRAIDKGPTAELASGLLELARCYQLRGDRKRAAPLYREGLDMMRQRYGDDHVHVAEALNFYSTLLREEANYTEALDVLRRALAIYRRVLGNEHSYVAANLNNLAGIEYYLGRYRDAGAHAAEAVAIEEKLFGPDSERTGALVLMLANVDAALGDWLGAERAVRRTLAIDERVEGAEAPDVAGDYEVLGGILRDQGRVADGEPMHARALAIRTKALGPDHALTAASRVSLGVDWALEGRSAEAVDVAEAGLAALQKTYGPSHVRVAAAQYWLGRIRAWNGDLDGAEAAQRKALAQRRELLGDAHADTAASEAALAEVLVKRRVYHEALPLFETALAVRGGILPAQHPDLAATTLGVAVCLCGSGDVRRGSALIEPAAGRLQRLFPAPDPRGNPATLARAVCNSRPPPA